MLSCHSTVASSTRPKTASHAAAQRQQRRFTCAVVYGSGRLRVLYVWGLQRRWTYVCAAGVQPKSTPKTRTSQLLHESADACTTGATAAGAGAAGAGAAVAAHLTIPGEERLRARFRVDDGQALMPDAVPAVLRHGHDLIPGPIRATVGVEWWGGTRRAAAAEGYVLNEGEYVAAQTGT